MSASSVLTMLLWIWSCLLLRTCSHMSHPMLSMTSASLTACKWQQAQTRPATLPDRHATGNTVKALEKQQSIAWPCNNSQRTKTQIEMQISLSYNCWLGLSG